MFFWKKKPKPVKKIRKKWRRKMINEYSWYYYMGKWADIKDKIYKG